ncbi:MAG: hypothetical protein FWD34_01150 [Oscillospiraceae bacterium]|nr:hypothetical protein [Oscillospiraceae bacterium]
MFREMSFISYYFHWSSEEVLALEHSVRRRWCTEISSINASLVPQDSKNRKEKSLFDMR